MRSSMLALFAASGSMGFHTSTVPRAARRGAMMNMPPELQRLKEMNEELASSRAYLNNMPTYSAPPQQPAYGYGQVVPTSPPTDARTARVMLPLALISGSVGAGAATLFNAGSTPPPITMEEVIEAQDKWARAIVKISRSYLDKKDYVGVAAKAADELYGYGRSKVLFKPTKASEYPFRPTGEEAMSYFVGGDAMEQGYKEDKGFAINNGKGWKTVLFDNNQIDITGQTAIAMGNYYFIAFDGSVAKVEYTFGYKRNDDGKMRIYLHHSSVPYGGSVVAQKGPAPITMAEVMEAQDMWAKAIVDISNAYLSSADYVGVAAQKASELYSYGETNVLFKPTKAAEYPFRPTGEAAMSYFVGGEAMGEKGYAEDKGFAINNGKGWKKVLFDNDKVELIGPTAIAMGHYYFTALDNSIAKVEYTFGYRRNEDGKMRIFLHHSSLPYGGNSKWVQEVTAPH